MEAKITPVSGPTPQEESIGELGIEPFRADAPAGLFLSRRGAWYHDGQRVKHARLEALLHRSITRDDAGNLIVTTGIDRLPFHAEDAPIIVRTITPALELVLSDETTEKADARAFFIDDQGHVRCVVRQGALWALLSRSATQAVFACTDDEGRVAGKSRIQTTSARDWSLLPSL